MTVRTYKGPLSACGVQKTQNKIFKINDDKILLLSGFFPMHNFVKDIQSPTDKGKQGGLHDSRAKRKEKSALV